MLQARCLSDMGRLHCQAMEMMTDYSRLVPVLRRVNEMKGIVAGGALPLQAVASPSESISMLKAMGSHISAERFADLAAFLHTAGALRRFFADDEDHSRPELTRRFRNIPDLGEPLEAIQAVVSSFGQVRDNASPELADIRRRIASTTASMQGLLRRVMDSAVRQGLIAADAAPAMRDPSPPPTRRPSPASSTTSPPPAEPTTSSRPRSPRPTTPYAPCTATSRRKSSKSSRASAPRCDLSCPTWRMPPTRWG